jgi:hypothetical protein
VRYSLDEIRSILRNYPQVDGPDRSKALEFYGSASFADLVAIISDPLLERKMRLLRDEKPEMSVTSLARDLQLVAGIAAGLLLVAVLI